MPVGVLVVEGKSVPDDTNDEKRGLAGAPTFFPSGDRDRADSDIDPQVIANIATMEELRLSLDRLAESLSKQPGHGDRLEITRPNIIELLNCLHATLNSSLLCRVPEAEDLVLIYDHPAMVLLNDFIGVLKDLDNAKRHAVFDTPEVSKGASLTTAVVARRDALLELVDTIQLSERLPSRDAAEKWVEKKMRQTIGRERAITAKQLKEMRKTRRRKQRRAS